MLRRLKRWFALAVLLSLAFCAWMAWFALAPAELSAPSVDFSILPGSPSRSATRQIVEAGVRMPAWQFNVLVRATDADTGIKAGSYQVAAGVTPWEILKKITLGDFAQAQIVFIEGWTFRQMRAALNAHADVRHDTASLPDAEVMNRLGSPGLVPEGMFFPDTYLFGKGESDLAILARSHRAMQKQLQSAWEQRAGEVAAIKPNEALILASIVEKETGRVKDRAMIASVFVNRLRIGMPLQTDPTVIYGIGESFDGNLRRRDLETDTPFNTYTRPGLPPHPIAMPGLASIHAVMHPAKTEALYFVARGDGSSEFSRTLAEHNRAVSKYQRSGR